MGGGVPANGQANWEWTSARSGVRGVLFAIL
jgi:hypothetical protein